MALYKMTKTLKDKSIINYGNTILKLHLEH